MNRAVLGLVTLVILSALTLPTASAQFCGGDYSDRFPLSQLDDYANPFYVNDSYCFDFGDGIQCFACENGSNYLCYADSTDYACYLDDVKMGTFIDEGNGTDYGSTDPSLVLWATMNNTIDKSIYGRTGTLHSAPVRDTGHIGHSYRFDGSDDTMYFTNADDITNGLEHLTVNLWIKPNGVVSGDRVFVIPYTTTWSNPYHRVSIRTSSNADTTEVGISYGTTRCEKTSLPRIDSSDWSMMTLTFDSGNLSYWYNGEVVGSMICGSTSIGSSTQPMVIGSALPDGSIEPIPAFIDNVMVWNITKTPDEINATYNNQFPIVTGYSTVGASESSGEVNNTMTINEPSSITYYTDDLTLNFSATTDEVTFSVNVTINGTLMYENDSYVNDTIITESLLGYLGYGTQTIIVCLNTSTESLCDDVNPYIWRGLNVTVQNVNGSAITWNLTAFNSTDSILFDGESGSTLIEWDDLPDGTINLTANATNFDTWTSTGHQISSSMDFADVTINLYRIQYFHATYDGDPVGNLSVVEYSTGSYWNQTEDDNSTVEISLREMSTGIQIYQFIVHGYGIRNETLSITTSSAYNETYSFSASSLTVNTYDEKTYSSLTFNISVSNGTASYNSTGETNPFSIAWDSLPQGEVTVTISSDGFIERDYYTVVSPYSVISISAYLLDSGDGIYHSTYVITYQGSPIPNALLTVQKNMGAYYQTVEQQLTGASGSATMFLDPFTEYYWKVEAGGYISETYYLTPDPTNPIVYVRLSVTGEEGADYVNFSIVMDAVSYQFLPTDRFHNGSFTTTYEISSSLSDFEYFGWIVYYQNGTELCNEEVNDQPSGTTLSCVIPNTSGKYQVSAYFKRADYDLYTFNDFYYWVYVYAGFGDIPMAEAISDIGYWIIAVIVTMIITGFASRFLGFATGWLAIGIFAMFVSINPTLIVAGISGWLIIAIMVIAQVSLMVIRSFI